MRSKSDKAAQQRAYYVRTREEQILKAKLRRIKNDAKIRERRKNRYWKDPEANRAKAKAYYDSNKERALELARKYRTQKPDIIRARKRRSAYGISFDDCRELWNIQAGRCAICLDRLIDDGTRQTHVDHSHVSGIIRGILCVDCNVGLGRFKDNSESLTRAANYLRSADKALDSVEST